MKPQVFESLRSSRAARAGFWVLGMIFLGALGSGLWELFLRSLIVGLGNLALTLVATFWSGYVDVLHRDIGKLHLDTLSLPSFVAVMLAIVAGPWFLIASLLRRIGRLKDKMTSNGKNEEELSDETLLAEVNLLRKRVIRILVPLLCVPTVTYALMGWQLTYTRNAANWAERSLEILGPHLSSEEYTRLRSDLRAVDTANRFFDLEAKLKSIASKNSTNLPVFSVIRSKGAT